MISDKRLKCISLSALRFISCLLIMWLFNQLTTDRLLDQYSTICFCCDMAYFYFEAKPQLVSGIYTVVCGRLDASASVRLCVLTSLRGGVVEAHRTSGLRNNRKFHFLRKFKYKKWLHTSQQNIGIIILLIIIVIIITTTTTYLFVCLFYLIVIIGLCISSSVSVHDILGSELMLSPSVTSMLEHDC